MENLSTTSKDFLIPEEDNFDPGNNQYNDFEESIADIELDVSYMKHLEGGYEDKPENQYVMEHGDSEKSIKSEKIQDFAFELLESEKEFEEAGEEHKEDIREKEIYLQEQEVKTLTPLMAVKGEEEVRSFESDHFFEFPAEVLQDREAMISKLEELRKEQPALRRKNKLLEFWVAKHMAKVRAMLLSSYLKVESNKTLEFRARVIFRRLTLLVVETRALFVQTNQKITPVDVSMQFEEFNLMYNKALRMYQQDSDRILAMQNQLQMEVDNYENKVQEVLDRDERAFQDLIDQQRMIGVGLKFFKSAKHVSEVHFNNLLRQQITHREILISCRSNYIRHLYLLENLSKKLAELEKLGTDYTFLNFHHLKNTNLQLVFKGDEQIGEVNKLRSKMCEAITKVACWKEKDFILTKNIEEWSEKLDVAKKRCAIGNERLSKIRLRQSTIISSTRNNRLVNISQLRGIHQGLKRMESYRSKNTVVQNNIKNNEIKQNGNLSTTLRALSVPQTMPILNPGRR